MTARPLKDVMMKVSRKSARKFLKGGGRAVRSENI